jgi:predicted DNA-binding transcriptional regulator AlpA
MNEVTPSEEYITTEEYAHLARTVPATIRYWRHIGTGPRGFKLGRRVLYVESDVRAWIEAQRELQGGGISA